MGKTTIRDALKKKKKKKNGVLTNRHQTGWSKKTIAIDDKGVIRSMKRTPKTIAPAALTTEG